MKNLNYLPFKKNRFFTGKLLTAEDLDQEQQYFDNKRRLINRWMLGAGIVAGLEVIRVDDYSVSVEMGLALDFTGREILVDMPVIRKLSLLDGYQEATIQEGAKALYLYVEYACTEAEPVHNITNRAVHTVEEETFNKYREGYHLYVSDEEPAAGESDVAKSTVMESTEVNGILHRIYNRAEYIHQERYRQGICLAKIELVKAGEFYMIEAIIPPDRSQWAYAQPIAMEILRDMQDQLNQLEVPVSGAVPLPSPVGPESLPGTLAGDNEAEWQFAQGRVRIPVPSGTKSGYCIFSPEIAHGLGLGEVELILHVNQSGYSYSGSEDIFPEEEKVVEAAARLDLNVGTFVIGIRLLTAVPAAEVWIGWTAIRKRSRNEIKIGEPRIYIQPGLVNVKTREDVCLKAVCVNMEQADLIWQVLTPGGGTIEPDGTYHAPNAPGVYEVSCAKQGQERVHASVYVVVRE